MPVTDAYVKPTVESLSRVRPVEYRKMFGGIGLYCDGTFFAVIDNDRLYFKTDDANRPAYKQAGMDPWVPDPSTGQKMPYHEVPESVLGAPETLGAWIDEAVAVAIRKKAKK